MLKTVEKEMQKKQDPTPKGGGGGIAKPKRSEPKRATTKK